MNKQDFINYVTVSGILVHTSDGDSPISAKEDILDFIRFV